MVCSPRRFAAASLLFVALLATVGCGRTPSSDGASPVSEVAPVASPSPAPSPVSGLDAAQLREAVQAPVAGSTRARRGPSVDRVGVTGGPRVWRITIPGEFAARSARVSVSVGDRVVGQGVVTGDLQALVAVTTDGTGLVAGAPVSYRWEGDEPIAAGRLEVAR